MSKALMTHTQRAFVLSINIVTEKDNSFYFSTIPLIRLTPLIFFILSIPTMLNRQYEKVLNFCEQFYLLVDTLQKTMLKTMQKTYAENYRSVKWAT